MANPKVIFEDEAILVIDKPSGWITNEADTTTDQPVVQKWLKMNHELRIKNYGKNRTDFKKRSGIVHRLDKETSGILLAAKTQEAFENLQAQFKERKVEKTYTALVHGKVEPKKGTITAAVGRLPWRRDRFGVLPGGRESKTDYKVLSVISSQLSAKNKKSDYSLLELYPKTGRTHQIRIHLKHIGHPVVADEFYAGRKTARRDRAWCPRLFLHASGIVFRHPLNNRKVNFISSLPDDLTAVVSHLNEDFQPE